jgi:hypothetical protein
MKFPTLIYSWLAKSLMTLSQMLGKGSGTSLGGLVSELYKPDIVSYFQGKYKKIIFISGTNGKTTTRSLINHFLEQDGLSVCSNRGGANIFRGIVSSLVFGPDDHRCGKIRVSRSRSRRGQPYPN